MASKLDKVVLQAVKLVEPSKREERRVQKVANETLEMVRREAEGHPFKPEVVLGGSFAKGTWLKGEADIDIFMMFPEDAPDDVLKKDGLGLALSSLKEVKPMLRYAEHPYVEAYVDGIRVNVVPCFRVPVGKWRSAADRSPYHTDFVAKTFDDGLKREARLLKKFMKGLGIYGAEIKVQGFSGYVCEVLIWKYGSFKSVVEEAARFQEGHIISFEELDESIQEVYKTPLIIFDPIDRRRNLGAAISQENVGKFILSSRRFLQSPELLYFKGIREPSPAKVLKTSELLDSVVSIVFNHRQKSPDILWGELRRSLHHLTKQLEARGFTVIRSICASDEKNNSAFLFLLQETCLPPYMLRLGPTVYMGDDVDRFLEKNVKRSKLVWVRNDGRLVALQERKPRTIESVLNHLLSSGAKDVGLAPGLKDEIVKNYKICSGKAILKHKDVGWLTEAMLYIVRTDELSIGIGR